MSARRLALVSGIALVLAGLAVGWCWQIRQTPESRREARRATSQEIKACAGAAVMPYLEKLAAETFFHTWFDKEFPFLHLAFETRVEADFIAQLAEDQFIRFGGDGKSVAADNAILKQLLAFTKELLPRCTPPAQESLCERRLDGYFLSGDFDGAIALLESGTLPKRTPLWCKGTVAKLRAHKAMESGARAEAIAQLKIFIGFMLSEEQKDFEDCDPATGIIYSREWVAARNYLRCARLAGELKDAAGAASYKEEARKLFKPAQEKAKDDAKSLEALRAEMKEAGL